MASCGGTGNHGPVIPEEGVKATMLRASKWLKWRNGMKHRGMKKRQALLWAKSAENYARNK